MAQDSRNTRKKRRVRRNLSVVSRNLRTMQQAYMRCHTTLLCVLAQRGGEVTITQGTIDQVLPNLQTTTWKSAPGPGDKEFTVSLVTQAKGNDQGDKADPIGPAVTIRKIDDDNADQRTGDETL